MSLSSYLASKYLTADTSSTSSSGKKRKRKAPKESSGLIIADDDALGWAPSTTTNADDDTPLTISSGSAEFRKAKKNAWKTVGVPALQPRDVESEEADRIVAEAAKENSAAMAEDDVPVIEGEDEGDGVVKMSDGTHAGLQSAQAVAAEFEKRKREEVRAWEREQAAGKAGKRKEEETVYRDATGRRIDISMRRQEARREADAKAAKEREEIEAQKGDVQRAAKERRREELDEARFLTVARGVDDIEMNDELKEVERWNDPAAQFLSKKTPGKGRDGKWRKQVYTGAAAPNRYGIRPGYKWDGVDRGNGWEGERFKAQNRTARNKELDYAWQEDT
ncbi:Pre-mRNA-splicing factor of RES complex-domain-containing protein [Rhexocercosporidium sp. MPI-PUGE-AT-0058]|nr:Pre-mRNA-splicing factor of RES complex-domain-containing protein [Rhexocercosporidium sp. MPI-PUGE-AT-0058]